jgi:hypothetical protein
MMKNCYTTEVNRGDLWNTGRKGKQTAGKFAFFNKG